MNIISKNFYRACKQVFAFTNVDYGVGVFVGALVMSIALGGLRDWLLVMSFAAGVWAFSRVVYIICMTIEGIWGDTAALREAICLDLKEYYVRLDK